MASTSTTAFALSPLPARSRGLTPSINPTTCPRPRLARAPQQPKVLTCKQDGDFQTLAVSWISASVITRSFPQALEELRKPLQRDAGYVACREVIAAVLHAKRYGVEAQELKSEISLKGRESRLVEKFVWLVYRVDSFFDHGRRSLFGRLGKAAVESSIHFTKLEMCASEGGDIRTVVGEMLKARSSGKGARIYQRGELPDKMRDVVVCLTIFMRKEEKSRMAV